MARSDPTDFTFTILEGRDAGLVIPLRGWSMPLRGGDGGEISFGRTMKKRTVWYPGNAVASQQIIGPQLDATKINGYWPERYLGTDVPIDLVETFERLHNSGAQIRIDWQTRSLVGTIGAFRWVPGDPVGGLTDITWSLTFDPISEGDLPAAPKVQGQRSNERDDLVGAATRTAGVLKSIEEFVSGVDSFVGLVNAGFQPDKRELADLSEAIDRVITEEAQLAARMVDEVDFTSEQVNGAASAAAAATALLGEVSQVAADIFPARLVVSDELAPVLDESVARYDIIDDAIEAMESQFDSQVRFSAIAAPAPFVRIPAVAGTDLRDVAIDYYGNADLWFRIAERNGIEDSVIPDDVDEIIVPIDLPQSDDARFG